MDLGLEVPVFILVSALAVIEGLEALLEGFGLDFQSRSVDIDLPQLLLLLCEQGLQIADLGDEGRAYLGGELNIVNSVLGLIAYLAVRDAEFGWGACSLDLKLGGTDGALEDARLLAERSGYQELGVLTLPPWPWGTNGEPAGASLLGTLDLGRKALAVSRATSL